MVTNVFIDDVNLAFLGRFNPFYDEVNEAFLALNHSASPYYKGLNTFQVSGTPVKDSLVPAGAPSGSGLKLDSASDCLHLSVTSGNASGMEIESTSQFSFGFFGYMTEEFLFDRSWFTKHSSAAGGSYYRLQASSGGINEFNWELTLGGSNGTASYLVGSPYDIALDQYESVVATVDGTTDTAFLYISGIPVASSTSITLSPGSSGNAQFPIRIGCHRAFSSQGVTNAVGGESGVMAEVFFMDRVLTPAEVAGYSASGFVARTGVSESDPQDSLKDNIGAQSATAVDVRVTAWDPTDSADPSGARNIESGAHPAYIQVLTVESGLAFGDILQSTVSGVKALTIKNATSGTNIDNIRFWNDDRSAFAGIVGYEVAEHIDSAWLVNPVLASGSGIVGKTLDSASTVLRSDGFASISGYTVDTTSISGEQEVSQYIYIALQTNSDFTPGTYGPGGFGFRVTVDNA